MQRSDRCPEDREEGKSRPGSRRNSGTLSRRGSVKEEGKEGKRSVNTIPNSSNSTPKRSQKSQDFDFVVTGKPIFKRPDRSSSLPVSHRRPSLDSIQKRKPSDLSKRIAMSQSSKSRDTSIEEDMSLELSQVSDFEDMNSKYGIRQKFAALATSTPKKPRSSSLHSQPKEMPKRAQRSLDSKASRQSTISCSRDSSFRISSSSPYRQAVSTELDCSSVSPEYSAPSSVDSLGVNPDTFVSPRSQDLNDSSLCISTWQECVPPVRSGKVVRTEGEWAHFWAQYNGPQARPLYDLCPTPYRNEDIDLIDFDFLGDGSVKRSPDKQATDDLTKAQGLLLTAKEAQSIVKCAHILNTVISRAAERKTKDNETKEKVETQKVDVKEEEKEIKKKNLTLELRETNQPAEVVEEKKCETVTTQTDISLPNTKSAPKIFEKILRQLSKTSLEDAVEKKPQENKEKTKEENKEQPKEENKEQPKEENKEQAEQQNGSKVN